MGTPGFPSWENWYQRELKVSFGGTCWGALAGPGQLERSHSLCRKLFYHVPPRQKHVRTYSGTSEECALFILLMPNCTTQVSTGTSTAEKVVKEGDSSWALFPSQTPEVQRCHSDQSLQFLLLCPEPPDMCVPWPTANTVVSEVRADLRNMTYLRRLCMSRG